MLFLIVRCLYQECIWAEEDKHILNFFSCFYWFRWTEFLCLSSSFKYQTFRGSSLIGTNFAWHRIILLISISCILFFLNVNFICFFPWTGFYFKNLLQTFWQYTFKVYPVFISEKNDRVSVLYIYILLLFVRYQLISDLTLWKKTKNIAS